MQFLQYTALRLSLFFVVFAALVWGLRWNVWIAASVGVVVAFCVTYLFFNNLRIAAAQNLRGMITSGKPWRKGAVELDDASAEDRQS